MSSHQPTDILFFLCVAVRPDSSHKQQQPASVSSSPRLSVCCVCLRIDTAQPPSSSSLELMLELSPLQLLLLLLSPLLLSFCHFCRCAAVSAKAPPSLPHPTNTNTTNQFGSVAERVESRLYVCTLPALSLSLQKLLSGRVCGAKAGRTKYWKS